MFKKKYLKEILEKSIKKKIFKISYLKKIYI